MARPHTVDLATVEQILAEARLEEAEVLSEEVPTARQVKKLGEVRVQELDGSEIALGALWDRRPAAMVFLRHYG